jgi:hypothetical protein
VICGNEKYLFYVSVDGGASYTNVQLNNHPKLTWKPVKGEVFYRATCDEWELQRFLNIPIYDTILPFLQNPCSTTLTIQLQIKDGSTLLWTGSVRIGDIGVDEIHGILKIKPVTIDEYEWWDKDKDTIFQPNVTLRTVTYSTESVPYSEDVPRVGVPPTRGGMDLCAIAPGTPQIYTFTQQRIPYETTGYAQGNGVFGEGSPPTVTNCPTNLYYKASCTQETVSTDTLGIEFMRWDDIVNYILFELGLSYTIESSFLNDTNNPITGTANKMNNLVISLIADVVNVNGKNRDVTFDKMMDLIKKFNCFWWVEGNKIKVEHIKTITDARTGGIDLTLAKFDKYQVLNDVNGERTDNVYSFKIDIPFREEFSYTEGDNRIGTIEYENGLASPEKIVKRDLREYCQDVIKLINFPDSFSEDNYIILVTDGSYDILTENGILNGNLAWDYVLNSHLSWKKLLNNYWIYDRPFTTGLVNGVSTVFSTQEKMKLQTDIEFPNLDNIYDPDKYIDTNMGEGLVESFVLDTENSFIKVTLKHTACV